MTTKKQKREASAAKAVAAGIKLAADRAARKRLWDEREKKRKAFELADRQHRSAQAAIQKMKKGPKK